MSVHAQVSQAAGSSRDLLRFITCGSVDDGKSTLIGRLLHDSKLISDDQLAVLSRESARYGTTGDEIDFALLVDGLEAEREQGITIDVAYRFFATPRRSFIVADTPGHVHYTRNMATGASNVELAVILIDARKGVLPQTRRHTLICSMLGIRHVVVAVNKIDLAGYEQETFERIANDYLAFASRFDFTSTVPIPLSARFGDNVITSSANTSWYSGLPLLAYLETVDVSAEHSSGAFRFPVQWVNRPHQDFRGYAGTVASGVIARHDPVCVAPSGRRTTISEIVTFDGTPATAQAGDAVTIRLADEIDVARGDILHAVASPPEVADRFAAHVIWMNEAALVPGRSYLVRIGTKTVSGSVISVNHRIDVDTGACVEADSLALNEIGLCEFSTGAPVAFDPYDSNRRTGSLILIDRLTNQTVGAGMIRHARQRNTNVRQQPLAVTREQRALQKRQRPILVWLTGLSGAGKSTIANLVESSLHEAGYHTMVLDGDNLRYGLNSDLGFSEADRFENVRRAGEVATILVESGLIVICAFISPHESHRERLRRSMQEGDFIEVFVDTPIEECMRRDPKGLYAKVKAGTLQGFTGVDSSYEVPLNPEIHLLTVGRDPQELAGEVVAFVLGRQIR